jgi:hypothetical protein
LLCNSFWNMGLKKGYAVDLKPLIIKHNLLKSCVLNLHLVIYNTFDLTFVEINMELE